MAGRENEATYLIYFSKAASVADLTEDFLIGELDSMRYAARAATILLREKGTPLAVEPLKRCCLRPILDLQVTSIFTLQIIAGPAVADFALSLLTDRRYRTKWAAMLVACDTCGVSHRLALERRIKQTTSGLRVCPEVGCLNGKTTELLHFLRYLKRTNQSLGDLRTLLMERATRLTGDEIAAIQIAR